MLKILEKTFDIVKLALKLRSYRHNLLALNIANIDTPGYKRKDIPFKEIMESYLSASTISLKTTHPKHIKNFKENLNEFIKSYETETLGTPNNVNLEEEMTKLTENQILYEATLQALYKELQKLREAITEGGR